jgi:hypothetical protein
MLACIAARIHLEFNPTNDVNFDKVESILVEKHMRICIAITNARSSLFTIAPSEPILAEGAYKIMSQPFFDAPHVLLSSLRTSGINKGDRGELVGMLLLLLAHDHARAPTSGPATRPVLVTDFFKSLISEKLIENILDAPPSVPGHISPEQKFRDVFAGSCIWFNHFIKILEPKMICSNYLWMFALRGAAILCADYQRGIDIVVPIIFNPSHNLGPPTMSAILIQIKNDKSYTSTLEHGLFEGMDPIRRGVVGKGKDSHPFIRMVFALAATEAACEVRPPIDHSPVTLPPKKKKKVSSTSDDKAPPVASINKEFAAYDIWCSGALSGTFACVRQEQERDYYHLLGREPLKEILSSKSSNSIIGSLTRSSYPLAMDDENHYNRFMRSV